MKRNFSLIFFLKRGKRASSEKLPVYLRITVSKKRVEVTSGKDCLEKDWENGKFKGNSSAARTMNAFLKQMELQVHDAHRKLLTLGSDITAESLANELLGKEDDKKTLRQVFENHNSQMEALVGSGFSKMTHLRYQTALRHVFQFLREKYRISDIDIKKIDHKFLTDYDFFLRSVRKCSNNSAVKYLKNLKKIVKICLANGWILRDPFANFKATVKEIDRVCLTDSEVNRLEQTDFANERLERVKDIFLFSCYTGLAYIDIYQLKTSEVITGRQDERWIISNRQKTGIPTRIPLLPKAINLLEKYTDHPLRSNSEKLFPVSSNQKMNAYLKEIADVCGIKTILTFHLARHTFATTITLMNDVPIETVSKMLGHKNIKTTQHYAKIMDKKVDEDMAKLIIKLEQPKQQKAVAITTYNYTITK
ncbi:site-specific integrase [Pedobacter fastidiosus]|uniref:Site-specific integrase n=1 Tax=Pedobacter fastidiosus TaxID=2765361 RepID=A0ABR7KXG6_9SPHI|nr:site-specific integrase [Pedobacter fastidiosus]MBC6112772.1 site-specific integrase [Pedobacter fastidiosus]